MTLAVVGAGCGGADANTSLATAGPSASASLPATPKTGFGRWPVQWDVKAEPEIDRIVITDKEVVAFGRRSTSAYSRADGHVLRTTRRGCMVLDAAVEKNGDFTVVCPGEIRSVDKKTLDYKVLQSFDESAVAASFMPDTLAIEVLAPGGSMAKKTGLGVEIVLYDRATRKPKRTLPAETHALSLAGSESGLLVAVFQKGVELNQGDSSTWRPFVQGSAPLVAVPSPAGNRVYLTSKPSETIAVDVATAKVVRAWRGFTPTRAAWIREEAVAAVGSFEGIRIFELDGQEVVSPHEVPYQAITVPPDGSALCAHAAQTTELSCYFDR